MTKFVLMVACAGALCLGGSKDRDWQTGKVLDSQFNPYFAAHSADDAKSQGVLGNTDYSINGPSGNGNAEQIRDSYVIETEDAAYKVERVRLKMSVGATVKKYTKIKFAVDKNKLYLVDDTGKEYQTKIIEQRRRADVPADEQLKLSQK